MAQYTVQSPDGKTITLEGPEGASHEDVIAQAQKLYKPSSPIEKPGPIANAMNHAGDKLAQIPGSLVDMVTHPIDTISNVYGQQKQLASEGIDAAKRGDYRLALARGIETLMPGVGPNIAEGFKTIKSGDVSGGVGDMIGGAGPALALKVASMSPKVRAFASGAKSAMTERVPSLGVTVPHMGKMSVDFPVPAPIAGAATGAALGKMVGHPIPGAIIGAVTPVIRGGMRAAEGEPWFPMMKNSIRPTESVPMASTAEQSLPGGGRAIVDAPASQPLPNPPGAMASADRSGAIRIGVTPEEAIQNVHSSTEGTVGTRAEMMRQLRLAGKQSNSKNTDLIKRFESPEYRSRPDRPIY